CPRWVGHRAGRADDIERGMVQRQPQASERHDAGIYEQFLAVAPASFAFEEAEWITGAQARLAQRKDTPSLAHQPPPPAQTLIRPQRQAATDPHSVAVDVRTLPRAVRFERGRQLLPDLNP